MFILFSKEVG